ncbi:MAG TPA: phytoene desaturase family protein [Bacteroidales bacterium]|jgi:phytoene desaturase|nr:phytoene desaturase [Bacteroidales bacterium]OQB60165.1 MAG: zeta-carotene-forming phytoene desaturase [Bacteroidetes bacterium ADurb.Bin145]NMD03545.1 phytoene desaturase [Bacteroidales bacterium]HOU02558.1 phytoene desaturase family protein [Bacteroidales bacterium]HQG62273.1 phytoene desaturase family protein [Bacteroidales bacterium]
MSKKVLIAGAGLGGLSTALRLAKKGYKVEIIEKNSQAGGRLNQLKKDGFTFDTGPSFFSMSYEFEELARDCNIVLPFSYYSLDPLYTVSFSNSNKIYNLYKDVNKLAAEFREEEPGFEKAMNRYLEKSGRLYHDTNVVIKSNYDSLIDYFLTLPKVGPAHIGTLFRSFWNQVGRYFSSKEAREILSLVAFFLGRTPFDTPATYTLLSYTEFKHDGYYNVNGGMYRIVEGIVEELKKENVKITYNTEINDFIAEGNQLKYLVDNKGKKWNADVFLINADAAVFRGKVFKRKNFSEERLDKMEWTMGSLTIYLGIDCKLPEIQHHNYYLGNNYRDYAGKVYTSSEIVDTPYYYVNVLSRSNPECAPQDSESLFFVCPVPDLRYKKSWDDRDKIVDRIINDFSRRIRKDIRPHIVSRTIYTPADWQEQFNLHRGSGLGLSHKMLQIGGFRPKNYDERFRNVFYAGASTIPGTGLPMVVISSRLAAERIVKFTGNEN